MKILAVSQYYWPEPFNVSDICEELVRRGHDVTVLTGLPNYPEGTLYDGYDDSERRKELRNGVEIVRSWLWPRKTGAINRFLNYESFSFAASRFARKLDSDFDVVIAFEISPIMSANPAIAYAKKNKRPLLLYVIDIWPECLLAGGIARESPIYKHYANVSKRIYNAADVLAVTSPLFTSYITNLTDRDVSAVELPQYAEDVFTSYEGVSPDGYKDGRINLTFAGNVGSAQSVQTIVKTASLLKEEREFLFHIVGSGSELDACKKLAQELAVSNVIFHGRHDISEMPAYYAASDAMLATFADSPILGYTLPRKIQSYMAAGKPIIGTLVGEAKRVIEESECGVCCDAEDYKGLAFACREFMDMTPDKRQKLGNNAKKYYESRFSRESFFELLESELKKMKGIAHGE